MKRIVVKNHLFAALVALTCLSLSSVHCASPDDVGLEFDRDALTPDSITIAKANCALWVAIEDNNVAAAQAALRAGADVNTRGRHKTTPLIEAASNGNVAMVELLLKNRADRTISGGIPPATALQIAQDMHEYAGPKTKTSYANIITCLNRPN